ncbi:SagB family peptide dehydrogenase [uncultured Leifsonia sp.]|uniref:SagB family peptide dehydrogenase n=1 Tax=uncultured Leifsonia sp. TaxID=340359 RepID=UPI0028D3EB48|nr:SagB family peptide dehydrogenase [uncultured Leifsonia sp.]
MSFMPEASNQGAVHEDEGPDLQGALAAVAELPRQAQDAIREVIASAVETVGARGRDSTLAEIVQQVFTRSVKEYFTEQRQSTQLPNELLSYIRPDVRGTPLPEPGELPEVSLADALNRRRSNRNFAPDAVTRDQLSTLLHYAAGGRGTEAGYGIRDMPLFRYPSIGGLNSVDIGIVVSRVEGLRPGFYIYDPVGHRLRMEDRGDMRLSLQDVTFEAGWLFHAPLVIVLIHNQDKVSWKYKTRALRFSHVDLGAVMQNMYLVSTAMRFACCSVAGFFDDGVNDLLRLDGTRQFVSLLMGVGPLGKVFSAPAGTD